MMKPSAAIAIFLAVSAGASACVQTNTGIVDGKSIVEEKPFDAGGRIEMALDGGSYRIEPAAGNHIRVTTSGNTGGAKVELAAGGTRADIKVTDTPHNNFYATIEVPKAADLVVRLTGGELVMAAIAGNKDVESNGGAITIAVGDPDDYSSVDASVKAGDLEAGPFGGSKSGLLPPVTWTGPGKYTLRASLGGGSLALRSK